MFKENFIKLCNQNNVAPTVVCQAIGLTAATFSKWDEKSVPRKATLYKLAEYFGISVDELLSEPESITSTETITLDNRNMRMVPLYETVSAGFGAYASDNVEDYMPVYFPNPSEAAQTICIKVRGDSMYPKIENGDIIQVHKQESVDSGSIAVILVDGEEGLVKKVLFTDSGIELHSINPMYPPMRFNGREATRVRIVGLVTQVIKGINGRKIHSVKISDNKKELLDVIERMDAGELQEFNKIYNEYLKSKE